jgi:hypothetical protein
VSREQLPRTAASLRRTQGTDTVLYATKLAIRTVGRRVLDLEADARRLDQLLERTTMHGRAPSLCDVYGVGRASPQTVEASTMR